MSDFALNIDALNAISPAKATAAVTPSDGSPLPDGVCKWLWIGGAGDLKVDLEGGAGLPSSVGELFLGVPQGIFPYRITKVYATGGTTATDIQAAY